MGVGQNTRSENSSLSRPSKRMQSEFSEESEDSCENCAKWRCKYEKVHADANSMFCNSQSARCEVNLLEREAELQRCKLKRAQNISPPQPGNPRLEITHPPQVKGKSDSSRPSDAHPPGRDQCLRQWVTESLTTLWVGDNPSRPNCLANH